MVEASREVFGDIPGFVRIIFYISAAAAVFMFVFGAWLKASIWLRGKDDSFDYVSKKSMLGLAKLSVVYLFSKDCLFAKRVMVKSRLRAVMLMFVYWGFIILFIGTIIIALDYDLHLNILRGQFYLWYKLILNIAGGLALISLLFYILRRYVFSRNKVVSSWDDAFVLNLMFLIVFSGFCIQGTRLARFHPAMMDWAPVGAFFSMIIGAIVQGQGLLKTIYRIFWIFHALCAFTFIGYLPFSKQFHMFTAQITTLEASRRKANLWEVIHG